MFNFSTETGFSDVELNRDANDSDGQIAVDDNIMNDSSLDDICISSPGSTSSRGAVAGGAMAPPVIEVVGKLELWYFVGIPAVKLTSTCKHKFY